MNNESIGEQQKPPVLDPSQEAELKKLNGDFEPEKAGSGKAGSTQKEPDKDTVAMISLMYAGTFGILAARLGAHWNLSPAEVSMLAEPTALVIEKYYPDASIGCEAALVGAVFLVVVPRLMVPPAIEGEVVEGEGDGDKPKHRTEE